MLSAADKIMDESLDDDSIVQLEVVASNMECISQAKVLEAFKNADVEALPVPDFSGVAEVAAVVALKVGSPFYGAHLAAASVGGISISVSEESSEYHLSRIEKVGRLLQCERVEYDNKTIRFSGDK